MLKFNVHFAWKLIDSDAFEMSFTQFSTVENAQIAFDDFWGITADSCEYFRREIEMVWVIPAGEEEPE